MRTDRWKPLYSQYLRLRNAVRLLPFRIFGSAERFARGYAGRFVVHRYQVTYPHLPPAWDGVTITHLSDLHLGPCFRPELHLPPVLEACERLNSDIIAITGDFVDFDTTWLAAALPALRTMRAPLGVFGCLGNHDAYEEIRTVRAGLRSWLGPRLLVNSGMVLRRDGQALGIVGEAMGTVRSHEAHFRAMRRRWPSDCLFIIGLAHNPSAFPWMQQNDVALTLAGHTHGGQVSLTRAPEPVIGWASFKFRFSRGWYTRGDSRMYVSCGIGQSVPIRINCPPEIAHIRLLRGPAAGPPGAGDEPCGNGVC